MPSLHLSWLKQVACLIRAAHTHGIKANNDAASGSTCSNASELERSFPTMNCWCSASVSTHRRYIAVDGKATCSSVQLGFSLTVSVRSSPTKSAPKVVSVLRRCRAGRREVHSVWSPYSSFFSGSHQHRLKEWMNN
ncbi:hypothetical protein BC834DRAFT_75174 [Gloeopeniophorella convolvens]|nr:hypothetical protein BC834DRAFT_75174 [Gloeopeniophorella convolvens]